MTDILKQAISKSGISYAELERETGVKRASIMRFMRGETSLRLDLADQIARYFGIEIRWGEKK
jgi:transcriptional regulator with XRE-family HTH domain